MNVYTVTQLNTYIRALLDESQLLKNIYISGEISNFNHYLRSGHMYFTLKDAKSQLKCVMFASNASRLRFTPEDGMSVICRGRISVYERDGVYQLYVDDMQPEGAGALSVAFEQLKQKLEQEGLFSDVFKKPLPRFPKKIGVATSNSGAAVEDIKNICNRRYPLCELVICPTVVQGAEAPKSIVRSIQRLDAMEDIDLIIVGRGGGSVEDLWAFNTEEVARAVFGCKTPVISAVGHETDFTICDFTADMRAPTPSAAAELALPDAKTLIDNLDRTQQRMVDCISYRIDAEMQRLDRLTSLPLLQNPLEFLNIQRERLIKNEQRAKNAYKNILRVQDGLISHYMDILEAFSPISVLRRGYSYVTCDGKTVKSKNDVREGASLSLAFSDGSVNIKVSEVIKNGE